jgi:hypothetical protein
VDGISVLQMGFDITGARRDDILLGFALLSTQPVWPDLNAILIIEHCLYILCPSYIIIDLTCMLLLSFRRCGDGSRGSRSIRRILLKSFELDAVE